MKEGFMSVTAAERATLGYGLGQEVPGALTGAQVRSDRALDRFARIGLWALPVYGLANFIGTLSSQPDYNKNFPAYARYIRTPQFLASHLVASMLGTAIGLLGFTALFVYLTRGRRPGVAVSAFVLTVVGNMGLVAMFGVAAFAQRAIGKAFLAGHHDVVSLNKSVYGTAANATAGVGLGLFFIGMILFAIAASRSLPRAAGVLLAVWLPVFAIGSIMGNALDKIGSILLIGAATWIAWSVWKAGLAVDRES
jgi:hypothetical protein